jgi:hypothetical protein
MTQKIFGALVVAVVAVSGAVSAQTMATSTKAANLGSVKLGHSVMADGKPLAAGTYTLRVSDEMPAPVVGQAPDEARWVEFLQGGTVKGREIATVLNKDEMKEVSNGGMLAAGSARVQMLKGGEYYRVWLNHGGVNYLIHLSAQ